IMKEISSRKDNSGLADLLDIRTFEAYTTDKPFQAAAKKLAMEYADEFLKGNKNSFAFIGQSGIGKSHLAIAISRKLLEAGINVKHYTAYEIIQKLEACKYDEQNYNLEFGRIANCGMLFIDDLFKSSISNYYNQESIKQEDLREMFKIINYRYNKKLPIMVTSEIHFERFAELDQAIIGRINEMCNYKYLISVKPDASKNYRLTRR
ncbi:MAG TPA: ATP-binding protein, partial [Epulopiscium sp.]|nr:ATP-binding protein [Candidatus Epulonipiscium sp.]